MKKLFLIIASLAFTLVACQKEKIEGLDAANSQTISVTIPQAGTMSRAAGDGTQINRCILEIYRNGELYGERKIATVSQNQATFSDLRLVTSQTYDFVFWADVAGESNADKHYTTANGLTAIKAKEYAGNNDEFDAFFAKKTLKVTEAFAEEVTLTRPFGQLNVTTNDLSEIKDASLKPTHVKVNFKAVPTEFNALTGVASAETALEYTATVSDGNTGLLTIDYIWATPEEGSTLADFSMTFINNNTNITTNDAFHNIPIRRNYKTNVSGNLLTKKGSMSVTINPEFNTPDIESKIVEVGTTAEVAQALKDGATNIVVKEAPATDAVTISIPKIYEENNAVQLAISIPATEQEITLNSGEEETKAPAAVTLAIPSAKKVTIDLPESTVTLSGSYEEIDATTADNTLIIPEKVTVNKLTVKKGNVEIYGTVNDIIFKEGAGIVATYAVGDVATLKKAVALIDTKKCARIVLTADLDMQGNASNPWVPIDTEGKAFKELDGAGYTISNLYVDNYTGHEDGVGYYYGGLFYVLRGTVKNLTIDKATVTCHRGGALVGRMDHGTIENCHIKNATITSYQKVAGLVGFICNSDKDITIRNCSVNGCALKTTAPAEGLYQTGGLIGYIQSFERNVTVEGCSVSNISFDKVYECAEDVNDRVYEMEQCYSHAFIGTIANCSSQPEAYSKYTIELKNNTVAQQADNIPTCDRTDNYIGWWAGDYNIGSRPYAPKVIVDGVAKDRYIEVNRLVKQIEAGGEVTIRRYYDLSSIARAINITKPTTITLHQSNSNYAVESSHEDVCFINTSELTIKGNDKSAINFKKRVVENKGTLTVEGGHYTTNTIGSGTLFWNNDAKAVMTVKNVQAVASNFAIAGGGEIHIEGGYIRSTSTNLNGPNTWAYCVRAQDGGKMTIKDATVEGVQGAIACNGGSHILLTKVKALAKKTPNQPQNDAFYALYAAWNGIIEVESGEFYSDRTPCCLASDEDQPGTPIGGFILKGGKYSSKPYTNKPSNMEWSPAEGYKYNETGDVTYPWEIIAE